MYYVYVLKSLKTNRQYVGFTKNIEHRLKEHNSGLSRYTKSRGPWELIYFEEKETLKAAEKRERFFKSGNGRLVLKRILNES